MNRRFAFTLAVMIAVATLVQTGSAAPETTEGVVTHVTLYRGQAMVTRTISVEGEKGSLEVVVTNLPEQIMAGSMFAEGTKGIEVRAVQQRNRAVGEEPREEVRKLDEQIATLMQQININNKSQQIVAKRVEYLDKLDVFITGTGKNDFQKDLILLNGL